MKPISTEVICCGLLIICAMPSSGNIQRNPERPSKDNNADLNTSEDLLAAQQRIEVTPYPSAEAAKPEIPFEDEELGVQATPAITTTPDPVYGPPEPDLTYGPPATPSTQPPLPSPFIRRITLDQLPSVDDPVDFIAPLLETSDDVSSNELQSDTQIVDEDNRQETRNKGDLSPDIKQTVPVIYTDAIAAAPWSWFPSSHDNYRHVYIQHSAPSSATW